MLWVWLRAFDLKSLIHGLIPSNRELVFFVVLLVIMLVIALTAAYTMRHEGIEHSYARANEIGKKESISVLTAVLVNCQRKEEAHHDQCKHAIKALERSIEFWSLNAQRSVARSTYRLFYLNYWQFFLGILTVGAIFWTLRETRRTATAAIGGTHAAENAQRARVVVTVAEHYPPGMGVNDGLGRRNERHQIIFDIVNIGPTAAIITDIKGGGKPIEGYADATINELDWLHQGSDGWLKTILLPGVEHKQAFHFSLPDDIAPDVHATSGYFAWCAINFEDCFRKERESTTTFRRVDDGPTPARQRISFGPRDFTETDLG